MIDQDQAVVLFGGWTSASRKAMLPVVEAKDALLFYPISYEGQECSKNIFYTGSIPNQHQNQPHDSCCVDLRLPVSHSFSLAQITFSREPHMQSPSSNCRF